MVECQGCIEKNRESRCWVESALEVCCDCAFPTPEERQHRFLELRRASERSATMLRDKYAMAALTGLLSRGMSLQFSDRMPDPEARVVELAFRFADKALAERDQLK